MLLVYGPRSTTYDFGPGHPLTPRRFGPGIDLLRTVGAEPGLAPEPAPDDELLWCHEAALPRDREAPLGGPVRPPGGRDRRRAATTRRSRGMHEAGATVAGGSIRAMEAILRGDVEHAFHPGGGLHHAMPDRASGFCIYDDPALAIARARRDGLRVLYVDFDVHHGDGVQAIHWDDPGVMTVSFHESGRYLFPGTGFLDELGEGTAAGTVGQRADGARDRRGGLARGRPRARPRAGRRVRAGPHRVSQHGADSHAWDPLAHLRVTTTAMGEAARLVDRVAHRLRRRPLARDRWRRLRRVPGRAADRGASSGWPARIARCPRRSTRAWRERWAAEARHVTGRHRCPARSRLARTRACRSTGRRSRPRTTAARWPRASPGLDGAAVASGGSRSRVVGPCATGSVARSATGGPDAAPRTPATRSPTILPAVDAATWDRPDPRRRASSPRPTPGDGHALVAAAWSDGARVVAAVAGSTVVGLARRRAPDGELLAIGVAPDTGDAGSRPRLLAASGATPCGTYHALAERDPIEPLDRRREPTIARRLLERAGFRGARPRRAVVTRRSAS